MKKMTALILSMALFLSGWTHKPEHQQTAVPVADPDSVVEDVLLQEVFTFTDDAGNVSQPQVLCRWEYDSKGRVTRFVNETRKTYSAEGISYTHSFASSPRYAQDPFHMGTEQVYTYDGVGNLSMITYSREDYGIKSVWQGIPRDPDGSSLLCRSIQTEDAKCEINYYYSEKGDLNQILAIMSDSDGEHYVQCDYTYDECGLLVKETGKRYGTYFYYYVGVWSPYDYISDSWERTYAYDEMGHLVSGTFTDYEWEADMGNNWIGTQLTDEYTFCYTGDRLTQVQVRCGDELYYSSGEVYRPGRYASYTVDIVYGNYYLDTSDPDPDNGLVVYTDTESLSISTDGMITLGAGILRDGALTEDVSGITFQIDDPTVLGIADTRVENGLRYIRLEALQEGFTYVTVNDSATGEYTRLPVTVYENTLCSFTVSSVPRMEIEKGYPTNVYNVNGLYVDSYSYTELSEGSAAVSFDVYNTNYSYGTVEVFREDGTLADMVLIQKMSTGNTSLKEVLWDNTGCMFRDIARGNLMSYRQETGFSKKTHVEVIIPPNGHLRIMMDSRYSNAVYLINYADILMSLASLEQEGMSFDTKEYCEKLSMELVANQFGGLFDSNIKVGKRLWDEVGLKATFANLESMQTYLDTASEVFSDTEVEKILVDAAWNMGWDTGEDTLAKMMGPAGVGLKAVFLIGKAQALILQTHDFLRSANTGAILILNQSGGFRSCEQIRVECKNGFSENTSLSVIQMGLDQQILDKVQKVSKKLYNALQEETCRTYNITLVENGRAVQPGQTVTVMIPVPEELEKLAKLGKISVYRVEADGTLTNMEAKTQKGYFVFATDHFSLYTLVKYTQSKPREDTPGQEPWNPAVLWIAAGGVLAAGGAAWLLLRKKKAAKG